MDDEGQNPRPEQHPQDPFDLLTDDPMLYPIFEFVGTSHFRFIAGVSRRFRRLYTPFQQAEYRKRVPNEEEFNKLISTSLTSTASIAESVSQAELFLEDTRNISFATPIKIQKNGSQDVTTFVNYEQLHSFLFLRDMVAVKLGRVEILQLLQRIGCPWSAHMCANAAVGGLLEVLQWLRENGCPWDEETSTNAAKGGYLDVLRWARENGCPWNELTCSAAAEGGHLKVLRWARDNHCPWDVGTCTSAAESGHLEVLQWARQNGCPWNEMTCMYAARMGHLEVLQWARENGCPWDEETCSHAARRGHLEVLQWALENGCEWDRQTIQTEIWPQNVVEWLQGTELLD